MFQATITETGLVINCISSIAELIDEAVFKITKKGIGLIATDRAMVAVVDLAISANAFEKYDTDKDYAIGLNIGNFLSVLKRAGVNDKITFNLQKDKFEIIMENSSRRRFLIPLLDLSQEEVPPVEQLEFSSKVQIKPDVLQSGIEDAEVVADSVLFEASPEKFEMRAEGDVSQTQLELEKGNEALISLKTTEKVRSRYPLDYLKKMIKGAKIADAVSIDWGQDFPMRLGFKTADKVSLTFILAPRVTEE